MALLASVTPFPIDRVITVQVSVESAQQVVDWFDVRTQEHPFTENDGALAALLSSFKKVATGT